MIRLLNKIVLVIVFLTFEGVAFAQSFPTRPIRFIIGFTPRTIVDAVARLLGNDLEKRLEQPIVLEFKPGANATIAAKYVVNSSPDGYTYFYGNVLSIHPLFMLSNAVDAAKDFASVSRIATAPFFIYGSGKLPVKTFQDLVRYAKSNPDSLTYGSTSQTFDLLMQMLRDRTGIRARGIPYKVSTQITVALLAGELDLAVTSNVQSHLPGIQSGATRPLFVTSARRSPLLPNVPTAAEVGISDFELSINFGLWAPVGTPRSVIDKLSRESSAALKGPDVAKMILSRAAAEAIGSTAEEQLRTFEAEVRLWTEAARAGNFQPQ